MLPVQCVLLSHSLDTILAAEDRFLAAKARKMCLCLYLKKNWPVRDALLTNGNFALAGSPIYSSPHSVSIATQKQNPLGSHHLICKAKTQQLKHLKATD